MDFPSWMIRSMRPMECAIECPRELSRLLRPLATHAFPRTDEPGLWMGQTSWGWEEDGEWHAFGWDWVEMQPEVMSLADPMAIVSNVQFASHNQAANAERARVLLLNNIVYFLPWQEHVRAALGRSKRTPKRLSVIPKSAPAVRGQTLPLAA